MPYAIVVAGATLYRVSSAGVATPLPLPDGVTLSTTRPPRLAVFGRNVILTNNPTRSLAIDPDFNVRPLQLVAPVSAVVLGVGGIGGLAGTYQVKYTHAQIDPETGGLVSESDFSPISAPLTLAGGLLNVTGISASPDLSTTHHRLYRTLADGDVFYWWLDVEAGQTTIADDLSDLLLPNLAAPRELGAGPGLLPSSFMTLLTSWKNRLWGVGNRHVDTLRYSGEGLAYGWPATYGLDIDPIGADEFGITGLMARKDLLGVAKRTGFTKVSGGLPDGDGVPQWDVNADKNGQGCFGPSIVVGDTAYYLGPDGVYEWGADGFKCLSDGRVRRWFAKDDDFNRARFADAFVKYNERYDSIEWHLAAAGSTTIDRWVSYDRASGAWHGPHRTNKAGPTSGFTLIDAGSNALPVLGADDGTIYVLNQAGYSDAGVAIPIVLRSKWHDADAPTILKTWLAPTFMTRAIALMGQCRVQYRVGPIDVDVTQTVPLDLRLGTETLPRVGTGQFLQLEIHDETNGAACEVYGYEVPYYPVSNRVRR